MLSLGESLSDQDIEDMIKAAAKDPDNSYVTLKDFVAMYLVKTILNYLFIEMKNKLMKKKNRKKKFLFFIKNIICMN